MYAYVRLYTLYISNAVYTHPLVNTANTVDKHRLIHRMERNASSDEIALRIVHRAEHVTRYNLGTILRTDKERVGEHTQALNELIYVSIAVQSP